VLIALLQMLQRLRVHLYKYITEGFSYLPSIPNHAKIFLNSGDTRTHLVNVMIIVTFSLLTRTKLE